jgi:hypothetical protein
MARNGRITPRCRFCGTPVDYFRDLCPDCDTSDRYDDDGIVIDGTLALNRACDAALATLDVESTVTPGGDD